MKILSRRTVGLMCMAMLVWVGSTASSMGAKPGQAGTKVPQANKAVTKAVYVCPECQMMSLKPGTCPTCEKEMGKMHLLGTKDGKAMVCSCGADCTCDSKGVKDGKCACGMPVKKIGCKGMYVCTMGCPEVSATAGKCACGMEMKKVE